MHEPCETTESALHLQSKNKKNRVESLAKCAAFLIGGLFFGWNLLLIYAFSSMVSPDLPPDQQLSETFNQFLFGSGGFQVIGVMGLFLASILCFIYSGANFWTFVTGKQNHFSIARNSLGVIGLAAIVLGAIVFVFS